MKYEPYQRAFLQGVIDICLEQGWQSYSSDIERTHRALTAQGVTTVVAVDEGIVCGFAQVQSDGEIQAHLSVLAVKGSYRRRGVGSELIAQSFRDSGGIRLDLVTDDAQGFYESMNHSLKSGFRIYP